MGALCVDIIVEDAEPFAIEYDVRFGDPETQALLPLIAPSTDFGLAMCACVSYSLSSQTVDFQPFHSLSVVIAMDAYPKTTSNNVLVEIDSQCSNRGEVTELTPHSASVLTDVQVQSMMIFHGSLQMREGHLMTTGGRIASCCGWGESLEASRSRAYQAVGLVNFIGKAWRSDLGLLR